MESGLAAEMNPTVSPTLLSPETSSKITSSSRNEVMYTCREIIVATNIVRT